jgi:hypothetical protein
VPFFYREASAEICGGADKLLAAKVTGKKASVPEVPKDATERIKNRRTNVIKLERTRKYFSWWKKLRQRVHASWRRFHPRAPGPRSALSLFKC